MSRGQDGVRWTVQTTVRDYEPGNPEPVREQVADGNILTTNGAALVWGGLIGEAITAYSNANAHIGVGNGNTPETDNDTGLDGVSTHYIPMDLGFPTVVGETVTFQGTAETGDANFVWEEWSVRNAANEVSGTALNRKVQSFGEKTSSVRRTITVEITLDPEA